MGSIKTFYKKTKKKLIYFSHYWGFPSQANNFINFLRSPNINFWFPFKPSNILTTPVRISHQNVNACEWRLVSRAKCQVLHLSISPQLNRETSGHEYKLNFQFSFFFFLPFFPAKSLNENIFRLNYKHYIYIILV